MNDYILREAATQAKPEFLNENHDDAEKALYAKGWNACNKEYIDNLLDIPPADVRPLKCGEWIRRCDSIFAWCPNCGCEVTQIKASVFRDGKGRIDFCPNCGAKMGGTP